MGKKLFIDPIVSYIKEQSKDFEKGIREAQSLE